MAIFRQKKRKARDVHKVIKSSKIKVFPGRFAVVKTDSLEENVAAFLMASDRNEVTLILEESKLDTTKYLDIQKWFKLIQLAVSVPFFSVGFLATVTNAIAQKGINVLVESTFSNDYLLIREDDFDEAYAVLKKLGFQS